MKIQKIIKIDLNKSAFAYPVRAVQYDTGVQLVLTLTDFDIPDGSIENITSVSPNMTIVTDTDGIIVDCEYIKDSNKVIEKLTNAIIALGGSV